MSKANPSPVHPTNLRSDEDLHHQIFVRASAMEEPLDQARALIRALRLMGFGLNAIADEHGSAVLAIAEAADAQLLAVNKACQQVMEASRQPHAQSGRRTRRPPSTK